MKTVTFSLGAVETLSRVSMDFEGCRRQVGVCCEVGECVGAPSNGKFIEERSVGAPITCSSNVGIALVGRGGVEATEAEEA